MQQFRKITFPLSHQYSKCSSTSLLFPVIILCDLKSANFVHFIAHEKVRRKGSSSVRFSPINEDGSREPIQKSASDLQKVREKSGRFTGNRSSAFLAFSRLLSVASAVQRVRADWQPVFLWPLPIRFLTPTLTPTSVSHSRVVHSPCHTPSSLTVP